MDARFSRKLKDISSTLIISQTRKRRIDPAGLLPSDSVNPAPGAFGRGQRWAEWTANLFPGHAEVTGAYTNSFPLEGREMTWGDLTWRGLWYVPRGGSWGNPHSKVCTQS